MGHRALVARERADGRHDLHRSQWGGADLSLAPGLAGGTWPPADVDPDPLATGVPWTAVVGEHLDPLLHEALFVHDASGAVRAYRTLWLGADHDDPGGLVVEVHWADPCDDARVLGWLAGARAVAAATTEDVGVEPDRAATLLEGRLRDWAGDREVLRVP